MIIAIANINEIDIDLSKISKKRLDKVEKFHFEDDKKRSLCAEFLLNHLIHIIDSSIEFPLNWAISESGKPYLTDYPQLYFNLSHSGDYAVCAVDDRPIGVDVELIKPISEQIARRFFTKQEYLSIHMCSDIEEMRQKCFYKYWVLKESFMKVLGMGMQLPMDSFEIKMEDGLISYKQSVSSSQYHGKIFDEIDGYQVGVCSENAEIMNAELLIVSNHQTENA